MINLGNNQTVTLIEMIRGIEEAMGMRATIDWQPEQPGRRSSDVGERHQGARPSGLRTANAFYERGFGASRSGIEVHRHGLDGMTNQPIR